jgi:Ferritin-like domain
MSGAECTTRAQALTVAGALVAGLLVPRGALAATVHTSDRASLERMLRLEQLQAAYYTEAERIGAVTGARAEAVAVLGGVERAHVSALRELLGRSAPRPPRFDFRGATEQDAAFASVAVAIEELSLASCKAQLAQVRAPEIVQAVSAIHSVEARHAAWMRGIAGLPPAPDAIDKPGDAAVPARYLAAELRTVARRIPRFPA